MDYHKHVELNIAVTLVSYIFFYTITRKVSYFLSINLKEYRNFSLTDKIEWNKRNGSTIHALLCCILGGLAWYTDDRIVNDPIWVQSMLSGITLSISVGYMLADVAVNTFVLNTALQIWDMMLHHLVIAFLFGINNIYGLGSGFSILRLFAELSTPFLSFRSQLYMIGKKDSKIAFYNNLMFATTFFISRIIFFPYFWQIVFQWWDSKELNSLGNMKWFFSLVGLVDILNIYWFTKVLGAVIRSFNSKKKEDKNE